MEAALVRSGNNGNGNNGNNGNGNGNKDKPTGSDVKKTSTVVKQFVVDFSREDFKPLMEHEINGLDYRYVNSDKARLSVVVQGIENGSASLLDAKGELHAYYHTDYLGTTDYLTSAVNSKVISWTSYSEWGEITHNAVLKCGQRELDLVKEYATHDFDAVLNMYYAKARFYDADNRRFAEIDPILDPSGYDLRAYVMEPMALGQYLYVRNNAVNFIDPFGEYYVKKVGEHEYYAVPASIAGAFVDTSVELIPQVGGSIGIALDQYKKLKNVGGNSYHEIKSLESQLFTQIMTDKVTKQIEESLEARLKTSLKNIGAFAGEFLNAALYWYNLGEALKIPTVDKAVFKMLEYADLSPAGKSVAEVEFLMTVAYNYVIQNQWFFLDPAYTVLLTDASNKKYEIPSQSAFTYLTILKQMKESGKSQAEIRQRINEYWTDFNCPNVLNQNPILSNGKITTDANFNITGKAANGRETFEIILIETPIYQYMLNEYETVLQQVTDHFKAYVNTYMQAYSEQNPKKATERKTGNMNR